MNSGSNTRRAILAAAAAALFTAGIGIAPDTAEADSHKHKKVHCEGVNSCKGHGDCATATHECSGQNGCKGKGWKSMTEDECEMAKEKMGEH